MLALATTILLAILGVGTFPCWRHSRGWGYGPAASAGVLMLAVAVVAVGGKTSVAHALLEAPGAPLRVSSDGLRLAILVEASNFIRQ